MRPRFILVLAALPAVLACPRTRDQLAPTKAPPPPKEKASTVAAPAAAPALPTPARAAVPEGVQLFYELSRDGLRVYEPVDADATVTNVQGDAIELTPAQGKPVRMLLRLPADMALPLKKDDKVHLAFSSRSDAADLDEVLRLTRGGRPVVEVATRHGSAPIEETFAGGQVKLRQRERLPAAEVVSGVRKTPLAVQVTAGRQVQAARPGDKLDVRVGGGALRVWIVGSLVAEPAQGAQPTVEGQPYQLTAVVAAPAPG